VFIRSVPLDNGAPTVSQPSGDPAELDSLSALSGLLDGAPRAGLCLPCRSDDADLWFADDPAELERAKSLCEQCPVRAECLAGALRRREPWGVWGGEIFERGTVIARKRPRGRPSNADLARDRELDAMSA
jgi:WhiB family redox-sensing transcriptional regulator